jgi:hypothetical protein
MIIYRISNWSETFEVAQSKRCERMTWVPIPYAPTSYGFCALMDRPDGAEIYGIFMMCVMEASQSRERGELTRGRNQTPHDARSLSLKLRLKEAKVKSALEVLSSDEIGWIDAEVIPQDEEQDLPGMEMAPSLLDPNPSDVEPPDPDPVEEKPKEAIDIEKVMPAGWKRMADKVAKVTKVKENTPLMVELGGLFNRRESTMWTVYEAAALHALCPMDPAEYRSVRTYYRATIDKREDIRRRDLITLLNNWPGEVDRATRRANVATGGIKKSEQKSRPMPTDFDEFLDDFNPALKSRKKSSWGQLKKEYDNWKKTDSEEG